MAGSRIWEFIRRILKMNKKNDDRKKLEVTIKVKYNVGSRPHEEVFNRYALFGQWMAANWWRIRIIDISVKGTY